MLTRLLFFKDFRSEISSDEKFERFMSTCLQLQKEKRSLEMEVRVELDNWRLRAKKGAPSAECKHRISECLKRFKVAQEMQDILIDREKTRLGQHANQISKDSMLKLKNRLQFFSLLNKQHESLLEMVRKDVQDCRSICRNIPDDSHIRYDLLSVISLCRDLFFQTACLLSHINLFKVNTIFVCNICSQQLKLSDEYHIGHLGIYS